MTALLIAHAAVGVLIGIALAAYRRAPPAAERVPWPGIALWVAFWLPLFAIAAAVAAVDAASGALRSRRP